MSHGASIPIISVEGSGDSWRIMASSYGSTGAAGPRLFRAEPWPKIEFQHTSEADAKRDAAELVRYIDSTWPKKISKDKLRRQGE
jgi:hypothetical protein